MQSDEPEATREFQPENDSQEDAGWLDDPNFLTAWESFQGRLRQFLERRIPDHLQAHTNASDVMQSAFLSLWRYFQKQERPIQVGDEELWKLLVTIARRKLTDKWRKVLTKKRGEGRVITATDLEVQRQTSFDQFVVQRMDQELVELLEDIEAKINEECQVIVSMRLAGMTNAEIATTLNCSLRRIERKLVLIKSAFSEND